MESEEEMYPDVRPKRRVRRPARLQDFEVDYMGYSQRDQLQWNLPSPALDRRGFLTQEGLQQMTPFQTAHHSSGFTGNAAHPEFPQLAPDHSQRRDLGGFIHPARTPSFHQSPYLDSRFSEEIRAIREENTKLIQTQQAFQTGIKELNEARREMKELLDVARSLKADLAQVNSPASNYSEPLEKIEQEDWPDPPPWPEPYENLSRGMCNLRVEDQGLDGGQLDFAPKARVPCKPPLIPQQPNPAFDKGISPYLSTRPSQSLSHSAPAHAPLRQSAPAQAYHPLTTTQAIQSLVGLLQTLGPEGEIELNCGSHVARLLSKLPPEQRADFRRHQFKQLGATHTLHDLAEWLRYESWCQGFDSQATGRSMKERQNVKADGRPGRQTVTVLHGAGESAETASSYHRESSANGGAKRKAYCAYCESTEHYLSQCSAVTKLSKDQLKEWIRVNKRCWRCARSHQAAQCTLKKPCNICQGKHLLALHEINSRAERGHKDVAAKEESCLTSSAADSLYLDRPGVGNRVMLKVVPVLVHYEDRTLDTFAVLDDGSERTMLLPAAAKFLGIKGTPEALPLRTVRQDIQTLHGHTVSFHVSPAANPHTSYKINGAFTAGRLSLAQHTYPIDHLKKKYKYLSGIPLPALRDAQPTLLVGSDNPQLITPVEPVRLGPRGGPAAVRTRLGWTLQGPSPFMGRPIQPAQCLFTSSTPSMDELYKHVERLWQVDTVPYRHEREVTRSKQDQQAVALLEAKTVRTNVDGILRYATPLLRHASMPPLHSPKESVMPLLRSTERRLLKDPKLADAYKKEMQKLIEAGAVREVTEETSTKEGWYISHHLVSHNGKNRLVFNCSHQYLGQTLNQYLLPGPTLGAPLLGVLLRFREHPIAVSGDIKGMFHQVRLLTEDRPLLSPCCATYALQRHVVDHCQPDDDLRFSVENCFYVDNCLQSTCTPGKAKLLVDRLRDLLASAGFELRQWACNDPGVLRHLPQEARSESLDLWLAQDKSDPLESTLGLSWNWATDSLGYKHRPVAYEVPTLRNIYRVLATQYDPLGYMLPFSTRAKIIIRQLWEKKRGWDDSNLPIELLQAWSSWEAELESLPLLTFPRAYVPLDANLEGATREVHIFADASEQAYGAVAYMRTENKEGQIHLSFILARSRVAPRRLHSIPRLELCGALVAAQLAHILERELTLTVARTVLWSDSTTVLTWLHSQSCRYKIFVGARIAEIQELTEKCTWRYVDSANNPADDLTRGKTLEALIVPNRWSQGPPFLLQNPANWPERPSTEPLEAKGELRKATFCGVAITSPVSISKDDKVYQTWQELLDATAQEILGQTPSNSLPNAEEYKQAEIVILQRAQQQSFPEDYKLLAAGKPVSPGSRLLTLAPELDKSTDLIRVGGRLRRLEGQYDLTLHPVVLDATHPVTRLLIQRYDSNLQHPGPERVFAEMRRSFWIIHGREAIRRYQRSCAECQRWRAQPSIPRMADLPAARLRLHKPAFHSTGVDCFGPMFVKMGRRQEKRWGIIFKCLTTRAVHLDLLRSMDADAYLMALRRFIARRGTPAELLSDQGTNFRGGERELREAFASMEPTLREQLARQRIKFQFNPPAAPHFGGVWEREVRSVKSALYTCVGAQPVHEDVLLTVLLEVEAILNSKPLGYVSADIADIDPVTPNSLLMGRPDGSLPQVVYPETELLSRRRWRHSQVLADQFWSRFIREYLPGLQTRQKWHSASPKLLDKAVVMLVDPQLPRALWPIGHVTKIHRSDDGCIRSADVDIKGHVYTRPVARLVMLPALPSGEDDASVSPTQPD
ncbi:guanine nucleotide-binding protein G(I)/G(S)/G(O) subunit gamma-2 [Pimephales promelas]|nr:guanine nucleotide-binding protein G(I)/G(S)/G(O) subunit gamma-2 [Pimephales promelas]